MRLRILQMENLWQTEIAGFRCLSARVARIGVAFNESESTNSHLDFAVSIRCDVFKCSIYEGCVVREMC